ncbi:MAG: hypothetical protein HW376_1678, partial [candidate division NC10 bacterium]|nr:hypothetical protein [candidate division NC10 bacterium]
MTNEEEIAEKELGLSRRAFLRGLAAIVGL